ncbi:hypothetical protein BDR03DRAFT_941358 [Suillus americanus]|nr:hypothetical protein BDR03DRAFT_941358 [Suillus americanus]
MFTRLSTVFVVLLGLMALVSAGVPDKRDNVARVVRANYAVLAHEESPEPDPGKSAVVGREESPEPDPGKSAVVGREESPEPDPGKSAVVGREESPEPDPGKSAVVGRGL